MEVYKVGCGSLERDEEEKCELGWVKDQENKSQYISFCLSVEELVVSFTLYHLLPKSRWNILCE